MSAGASAQRVVTYPGQTVAAERPEERVDHDHRSRSVTAGLGRSAHSRGIRLVAGLVQVDGNIQEAERACGRRDEPWDAAARAVDDTGKEDERSDSCPSV